MAPVFRRVRRARFWQRDLDHIMAVFTSVLCAIDFSEHSAQALRCAATMAATEHAALHVIAVIDPVLAEAAAVAYNLESLSAETASDLRGFLTTTLGHRPAMRDPAVRVAVGDAAREILRAAETVAADLIVMGTHGLGGPRKVFFGSTTDHVVRDAGRAVLVVPLPSGTATNPIERGRSIVAGVHVEHPSRKHVSAAIELGRDFKAPVVLVHAVAPIQTIGRWRRHADFAQRPRRSRGEMALDVICAETRRDVPLEPVVEYGEAAAVLMKAATDWEGRLIVIGLGRRHGSGYCPGSIAYRVMCGSDLPVLAIPGD